MINQKKTMHHLLISCGCLKKFGFGFPYPRKEISRLSNSREKEICKGFTTLVQAGMNEGSLWYATGERNLPMSSWVVSVFCGLFSTSVGNLLHVRTGNTVRGLINTVQQADLKLSHKTLVMLFI